MNDKWVVIFSGYNQRAVVAFLRTLACNHIQNYSIIAASKNDTILKTSYSDKVDYIRQNRQLDLNEVINAVELIKEKYLVKELLIAPSTEGLNRFLLEYDKVLFRRGCIIPFPDKKIYELISDKEKFWNLCYKEDIMVPPAIELDGVSDLPFVAKPKKYTASDGKVYSPVLVRNQTEYNKFVKEYTNFNEFDYQRYIWGESYYLLFYFTRQQQIYKFSQKNLVQQPNGKSILMAECAAIHQENISCQYENLFLKLGYFGFVMVELRKHDNKYYMIEANPRFWGPSQLFCDAGYNFFEFFLYEYGFLKQRPQTKVKYTAKYFWSGGVYCPLENCDCYVNDIAKMREVYDTFACYDIYNKADTYRLYKMEQS